MQFFNRLVSLVFSRQTLVFATTLLLALLVWFIGPLLAIEGLRPLASTGARVGVIVLLLLLAMLWLKSWPFHLVGVPALCLLVWYAGPLLAVGAAKPLTTALTRALIVGTIALVYAIYALYKLWRLMQANEDFVKKILTWGNGDKTASAQVDMKSLNLTVNRALASLRGLRGTSGLRRIFEGQRYLYELPWYMIVGSPGAGKTTALLSSGLQFPIDRHGPQAKTTALHVRAKDTMHCEWWFTNEAVLIDTAGRYTVHDDTGVNPAEWNGFLGLLRKHRTRAPLNGVIVALGTDELLTMTSDNLAAHGAMVRERLAELRQRLGIRLPVYVIVTKVDRLKGFQEYFHSLTMEGRSQPWGFTFPIAGRKQAAAGAGDLHARMAAEFALLRQRLEAGLRPRLAEEFDLDRRRRLFALPQELSGLSVPLMRIVEEIFQESRFDATQARSALRGVYLTSGAQVGHAIPADPFTLMQRLKIAEPEAAEGDEPRSRQGYFLRDVFARIIIPEAHLVRPNLRWEWRYRLLRLLGHALALVLFLWIAGALSVSFGNNRSYLQTAQEHTEALGRQVKALYADFKPAQIPEVLSAAREVPGYPGLSLLDPPASYQWGLYAAPDVLQASQETYARLQDQLLLPAVLRRMEEVLAQSVRDRDAVTAYQTLRIYKLLHDPARYRAGGAQDVRDWVLTDWRAHPEVVAGLGGSVSLVAHAQNLFSGARTVQSATLPNESLVREVQAFLNANTSSQRIYERAKAAMLPEAPPAFTLVSAVGPQAGTVFARANGAPMEQGVPGLFTYEGYHQLFNKRLLEFAGRAIADDAWVMGQAASPDEHPVAPKSDAATALASTDPVLQDIRRRYLEEYAKRWQDFLDSIRLVGTSETETDVESSLRTSPAALQVLGTATTHSNLGFQLNVLRQLAAPDSPLARLGRTAVRETTLSRSLSAGTGPKTESTLIDKAASAINKSVQDIGASLNIRPEEQMEKQVVDNRFAALREVVAGQSDAAVAVGVDAGKPGLQGVLGLINAFYTELVVADSALSAGSLPPSVADVGTRLKLEADKLPAPFRSVLAALALQGADQVAQGSAAILRTQALQQLDRIMGLMAFQVSEPCKRGIEGRYPFADVAQDASPDDVTQVFAAGGAADAFFAKYLAPFVDTSVRPWRYKSPDAMNAMVGTESAANAASPTPPPSGPTLVGELLKLLTQSGPALESFSRAQQIRDALFRSADGKTLGWRVDLKVLALDPSVTDLVIDIDGQGQRYVHGPVQGFPVSWPGPRGGGSAMLSANPRISNDTSTLMAQGPWALLRLFDKGRPVGTSTPSHTQLEFSFDSRKALLDVATGSQPNPLNSAVFKGFRCPGRAG